MGVCDALCSADEACGLSGRLGVKQTEGLPNLFLWSYSSDASTSDTLDHFALPDYIHADALQHISSFFLVEFSRYFHLWREAPEANSPLYVTWKPLTRRHTNRCRTDWIISGLGGCRPPWCGRGEKVLINRLVAMLMSHTFAGAVPDSSWITHCFSCQISKLHVCSVTFDVRGQT